MNFQAITATSRNLELSGFLVSGRFAYRTKSAPAPAFRIKDDGTLEALNNGDDEY